MQRLQKKPRKRAREQDDSNRLVEKLKVKITKLNTEVDETKKASTFAKTFLQTQFEKSTDFVVNENIRLKIASKELEVRIKELTEINEKLKAEKEQLARVSEAKSQQIDQLSEDIRKLRYIEIADLLAKIETLKKQLANAQTLKIHSGMPPTQKIKLFDQLYGHYQSVYRQHMDHLELYEQCMKELNFYKAAMNSMTSEVQIATGASQDVPPTVYPSRQSVPALFPSSTPGLMFFGPHSDNSSIHLTLSSMTPRGRMV